MKHEESITLSPDMVERIIRAALYKMPEICGSPFDIRCTRIQGADRGTGRLGVKVVFRKTINPKGE